MRRIVTQLRSISEVFVFRSFVLLALLGAFFKPALAQVGPQPIPQATPLPVPTPASTPTPGATPIPGATPGPQDPRKDDTPGAPKGGPGTAATPAPGATPAASPTPAPPKTIEELTKGFDKSEGIFTLYRKLERNEQKILAEVRESQVGTLFLLQSSYATGSARRITAGRSARDLL